MKKPLILSLVFAVMSALFTALYLISIESKYKKGTEMVGVLIAVEYIQQGKIIEPLMVEEKLIPKSYLQPKALQSANQTLNDRGNSVFMSLVPIEKGEQIMATKLSYLGIDTGISMLISDNMRAVTLKLDSKSVLGVVAPGNKVDLISVFDYEDKKGNIKQASKTVLQNILVLAVGDSFIGSMFKSGRISEGDESIYNGNIPSGDIPVTFSLIPYDAEIAMLMSEKSKLSVSLRPFGDEKHVESNGVTVDEVIKGVSYVSKNRNKDNVSNDYLKTLNSKQLEAIELLEKYKKR